MSSLFAPATPPAAAYVRVVPHRGIERGARGSGPTALSDSALTYAVPDSIAPPVLGQLVQVPLGKYNTVATGIVIEVGTAALLGDLNPDRVKGILAVTPAIMPPVLLTLANWLAGYYVCPLGMVLQTMLPAAVKKQIGRKAAVHLRLGTPALPDLERALASLGKRLSKQWSAVSALASDLWPLTPRALANTAEGVSPAAIKKLTEAGLLIAEVVQTVGASRDAIDDLSEGATDAPSAESPHPALTPEQHAVVDAVSPRLGGFGVHLLRGVTGSGKTEVYLRLIEQVLGAPGDRTALVLVPEIALTPQTARRFLGRFGAGAVAVLHSALTSAQRNMQWSAAAAGRVRVVVGARSAVFAPLRNLGLIVVDEEHDSSYKQDQLPRYHARDVAIKRAQLENCPALLGSATPALESWINTRGPRPKYTLHELTRRVHQGPMPEVRIVDLMSERRARAQGPQGWRDRHLHLIGPTLESAIDRTLVVGGQIILLLNRRGYANYICCPDPNCGWVMQCEHCDATTVYHRAGQSPTGFVRCHHCLAELMLPAKCPLCDKRPNTFGMGTQRVEEELQRKFAQQHGIVIGDTLLRLDADTMQTGRDYFAALDRFASGAGRVLLGTQMIAKGLDFPGVQLVGVINADTSLNLPDFRAAERTFQLVAQVAGRAGRSSGAAGASGSRGLVIVQTAAPLAAPIVLAARHDYTGFAEAELAVRARAGLPPVTRMARIVCRDRDHDKASRAAHELRAALAAQIVRMGADSRGQPPVRLRGPMPCPISRIDDHHRIALELTAPGRGELQAVLGAVRAAGMLTSDAHTAVDMDPIALL